MDLEKQAQHDVESGSNELDSSNGSHGSAPPPNAAQVIDPNDPGERTVANIRQSNGVLRRLRDVETWMDRKMKVEGMGVERIPENKRKPPQILNVMFFWFSLLFQPTLIPIGILGPLFGLSVHTSIILTIFATVIGTLVPAFTGTLSAPTGLRQIAVARYSFGIWGAKFCGLLNVIVNVGYGVINAIVGGQIIRAVSNQSLGLEVGIIIIIAVAFVISFFGFAVIHVYERYAWILAFGLLCVLYAQSSQYFSPTPGLSLDEGIDYSGACLSYFAIIFGVCVSWCPIAGDYYVHYRADTSRWLMFGLTYLGLIIPTIFVGVLGNLFGGIIMSNTALSDVYFSGGIGALILATMHPTGWAKFASVCFFLSFLGNIIANIYSSSLSIQLWGQHFIAIPRSLWCLLLSAIILALAWGGRFILETIITNFLAMLGYWTLAFGLILFLEHFLFRPRLGGYDLTAWQDHRRLPWGVAGTLSLLLGIGVAFLGMDQTWFVAPIAKHIGAFGGDIGDELVFVSTVVSYPIFRSLEIKFSGR